MGDQMIEIINVNNQKISNISIKIFLSLISFIFLLFLGPTEVIPMISGETFFHLLDDQMITQRVSYNFWKNGQPFFNLSDSVSANTSLFWPIILSYIYYFSSHEKAVFFTALLSVGIFSFAIFISVLYEESISRIIAKAMVPTISSTAITYATSGWEHIPQMLFFTAGAVLILQSNRKCAGLHDLNVPTSSLLLVSISFIFRPDSAILIAPIGVFWFLTIHRYKKPSSYIISAALLLIPIVYIYSMEHFYGDIIPNTAHLKFLPITQRIENGIYYILSPEKAGLTLIALGILVWKRAMLEISEKLLLSFIAIYVFYIVLIGGDVFNYGRFFIVLLPSISILIINLLSRVIDGRSGNNTEGAIQLVAIAGVIVFVELFSTTFLFREVVQHRKEVSNIGNISDIKSQIFLSKKISESLDPADGSIGLHWLGIAYHLPEFHVVDFLGKAEPHIAKTPPKYGPVGHNKWDYDYAFRKYDIAAVPMPSHLIEWERKHSNAPLKMKNFMFWDVATRNLLRNQDYTFLYPKDMGLDSRISFGMFIRNDLLKKFKVSEPKASPNFDTPVSPHQSFLMYPPPLR